MDQTTNEDGRTEEKPIDSTRTLRDDSGLRDELRATRVALEAVDDNFVGLQERIKSLEIQVETLCAAMNGLQAELDDSPKDLVRRPVGEPLTGEAAPDVTDKIDELAGGPTQ